MIRAVIFDMDGTLFDTEARYGRGWKAAGLTDEQYHQMIGRGHIANDRVLESWGMNPAEIRRIRNESVRRELEEEGLPVKPGAGEALQWLMEQSIPVAVATSSPLEMAEDYMKRSGFGRYFAGVFSGFLLERGKPFPDLFLQAAQELGVDPADCMVVEDSYNGVRAGRNAGMVTVMVPDQVPADDEMRTTADAVLTTLLELPALIEDINRYST